jgi:hypothetical protein
MNKVFSILVLLVPVILHLLTDNGFLYSNLFLLIVFILHAFNFFAHWERPKLTLISNTGLILSGLIYFLIFAAFNDYSKWGGRDFFSMIVLFYVIFLLVQLEYSRRVDVARLLSLRWLVRTSQMLLIFSVVSVGFYLFNRSFFSGAENRFMGWSSSPTTFSIYLMWISFIIFSLYELNRFWTFSILSVGMLMIAFSGTRSTLLVYMIFASSFVPVVHRVLRKNFLPLVAGFIFLFLFFDTISVFLFEGYLNNWMDRYKQEDDMSLYTRQVITASMLHTISNSSWTELIFGHGINFSLSNLNPQKDSVVILAHNDFLKFIIDFGIYLTSILIYLIFKIFKSINGKSYIPLLIYFCSYFHNMALDHWNLFFLMFSGIILHLVESKY